jgi:hypothetical protein
VSTLPGAPVRKRRRLAGSRRAEQACPRARRASAQRESEGRPPRQGTLPSGDLRSSMTRPLGAEPRRPSRQSRNSGRASRAARGAEPRRRTRGSATPVRKRGRLAAKGHDGRSALRVTTGPSAPSLGDQGVNHVIVVGRHVPPREDGDVRIPRSRAARVVVVLVMMLMMMMMMMMMMMTTTKMMTLLSAAAVVAATAFALPHCLRPPARRTRSHARHDPRSRSSARRPRARKLDARQAP